MEYSKGFIDGAEKDEQSITADWVVKQELIDGVVTREIRSVPKMNGCLTEVWRQDWSLDDVAVDQIFQVVLNPGGVSAWHVHMETTDRLFVSSGLINIVLYDAREESPTFGKINTFKFGERRSGIVVIPPGVWHGVQNIDSSPSVILNIVDKAYLYESPDHWRLPENTEKIPYKF
jgi:dTDP-4-dehydrorhamnose 3,5-epimerase